jgi:hypothetical protein
MMRGMTDVRAHGNPVTTGIALLLSPLALLLLGRNSG